MAVPQPLAPWRRKAGRFPRGAYAAVLGLAAGLVVSVGAVWAEQPAGFADIDRFVEREMRRAAIPGLAYAVVGNGRVLHMNAFGVAGPDGASMRTDTVLGTASVGKTFTALAIRQLVNAGAIDEGAPVRRYLPWFTLADESAASRITVRDLLRHTSGISNRDGNRPWFLRPGPTLEELVRGMSKLTPNREVGTRAEYSNLNYLVLGAVVAAVSGESYESYLEANVFDRLGMTSSYVSREDARSDGRPVSSEYRLAFGIPVAVRVPTPAGAMSSGHHFTTVEDMARYAIALSDHGTYEGEAVAFPPGTSAGRRTNYNMSWEPEASADPYYGHGFSGGWVTYSAGLEILPNQRFGVVVLANANTSQPFGTRSTFDIAFDIMRLHHGWSLSAQGVGVRTWYAVADAILVLLAGAGVAQVVRLRSGRRCALRGPGVRSVCRIAAIGSVGVPLALLVGIPAWVTGMPNPWVGWDRFRFGAPDLAYAELVLLLVYLTVGIVRVRRGVIAEPVEG